MVAVAPSVLFESSEVSVHTGKLKPFY